MSQTEKSLNKKFTPTQGMLTAAENVFLAMAVEGTTRPIVEAYQRKILAERKWPVAVDMRANKGSTEEVTDIKHAWLMSTEDFAVYLQRCNEERIEANLSVETDDQCPLLVAENVTRLAKDELLAAMAGITKIERTAIAQLSLSNREKLVDLSLRLLAPFVKNPLA